MAALSHCLPCMPAAPHTLPGSAAHDTTQYCWRECTAKVEFPACSQVRNLLLRYTRRDLSGVVAHGVSAKLAPAMMQAVHPSVFEALRSAIVALDRSMQRIQVLAAAAAAPRALHSSGCWRAAGLGAIERSLMSSPSLVASPA